MLQLDVLCRPQWLQYVYEPTGLWGGVKDRYIKYEKAGDQFVGRAVSGLPILKKEFAVSQPFFDFTESENEIEYERKTHEINNWVQARLPQNSSNESVFYLLKNCVASLVYHRDFLDRMVHGGSALRSTVFWVEEVPHANDVRISYPWDNSERSTEITGIPPHTSLLAQIERLKITVENLQNSIGTDLKNVLVSELDSREIGGAGLAQGSLILSKLDLIIEKTKEGSRQEEQPITEEGDLFLLEEESPELNESPAYLSAQVQETMLRDQTRSQLKRRQIKVGYHHGKLNPLPSTWKFPRGLPIINLITLWIIGNKRENIPPLRLLTAANVEHLKQGRNNLSKMKQVMIQIKKFGVNKGMWENEGNWNGEKITALWSVIWEDLDPYLRTEGKCSSGTDLAKSRKGQISWRTCYNNMQKKSLFVGNRTRRSQGQTRFNI